MGKHGHTHISRKDNKTIKSYEFLTKNNSLNQEYGQISKCLGDCRFLVKQFKKDENEVISTLPRRFKKGPRRIRIDEGHTVLIQPMSEKTWEIIYVYSDIDLKRLRREGEIEENQQKSSNILFEDEDDNADVSIDENDGIVDEDLVSETKPIESQFEENLDAFIADI